jgi:hypothetical protein
MGQVELLVEIVAATEFFNILAEIIEECWPQQIFIISETELFY